MTDWPGLITAITALVVAVGGVVGLVVHKNAPDPHPKAVTLGGQVDDSQTQKPV